MTSEGLVARFTFGTKAYALLLDPDTLAIRWALSRYPTQLGDELLASPKHSTVLFVGTRLNAAMICFRRKGIVSDYRDEEYQALVLRDLQNVKERGTDWTPSVVSPDGRFVFNASNVRRRYQGGELVPYSNFVPDFILDPKSCELREYAISDLSTLRRSRKLVLPGELVDIAMGVCSDGPLAVTMKNHSPKYFDLKTLEEHWCDRGSISPDGVNAEWMKSESVGSITSRSRSRSRSCPRGTRRRSFSSIRRGSNLNAPCHPMPRTGTWREETIPSGKVGTACRFPEWNGFPASSATCEFDVLRHFRKQWHTDPSSPPITGTRRNMCDDNMLCVALLLHLAKGFLM